MRYHSFRQKFASKYTVWHILLKKGKISYCHLHWMSQHANYMPNSNCTLNKVEHNHNQKDMWPMHY